MVRYSTNFRLISALVLVAFLVGCTKTVDRKPLETRRFQVVWEDLNTQKVLLPGGLVAEGVVLTPAQLPLEASFKRLFQFDFIGFFTEMDLRFSSSSLDHKVLRQLFDEGYIPSLVRVRNDSQAPRQFLPDQLMLQADGETTLYPVSPEGLPERFKNIDWAKTTLTVVFAVLIVFIILLAAKEGKGGNLNLFNDSVDVSTRVMIESGQHAGDGTMPERQRTASEIAAGATQPDPQMSEKTVNKGILLPTTIPPGSSTEGFIFFALDKTVVDWRTVQLTGP